MQKQERTEKQKDEGLLVEPSKMPAPQMPKEPTSLLERLRGAVDKVNPGAKVAAALIGKAAG